MNHRPEPDASPASAGLLAGSLRLNARSLPKISDKIVSTVGSVAIDKVSIIDSGGQGTGVPGFMGQLPAAVIGLAEQLENATGVDLFKALRPDSNGVPVDAEELWDEEALPDGDGSAAQVGPAQQGR